MLLICTHVQWDLSKSCEIIILFPNVNSPVMLLHIVVVILIYLVRSLTVSGMWGPSLKY